MLLSRCLVTKIRHTGVGEWSAYGPSTRVKSKKVARLKSYNLREVVDFVLRRIVRVWKIKWPTSIARVVQKNKPVAVDDRVNVCACGAVSLSRLVIKKYVNCLLNALNGKSLPKEHKNHARKRILETNIIHIHTFVTRVVSICLHFWSSFIITNLHSCII